MNNNTSFLSSIESGTTLSKLLFYYVIIALGFFCISRYYHACVMY